MENDFLYLSEEDVDFLIGDNYSMVEDVVVEALEHYYHGQALMPDKISLIFDKKIQNRINCMPASITPKNIYGTKWVSVFPSNRSKGIKNVEGFSFLSETVTGKLLCMMNSSITTSLRTAAVGSLAARYLASANTKTIGFIGAGEEAKSHFLLLMNTFPNINTCKFSARDIEDTSGLINELEKDYPTVNFIDCKDDYQKAIEASNIIVTAISSQDPVLKADWIEDGMLYIHVGGREDEDEVALKATKIVCDSWEAVKHRTQTLSQMYVNNIIDDSNIYADLHEIIEGKKPGRENEKEFIYFNSVGLSVIDSLLSYKIYELAREKNIGTLLKK